MLLFLPFADTILMIQLSHHQEMMMVSFTSHIQNITNQHPTSLLWKSRKMISSFPSPRLLTWIQPAAVAATITTMTLICPNTPCLARNILVVSSLSYPSYFFFLLRFFFIIIYFKFWQFPFLISIKEHTHIIGDC